MSFLFSNDKTGIRGLAYVCSMFVAYKLYDYASPGCACQIPLLYVSRRHRHTKMSDSSGQTKYCILIRWME